MEVATNYLSVITSHSILPATHFDTTSRPAPENAAARASRSAALTRSRKRTGLCGFVFSLVPCPSGVCVLLASGSGGLGAAINANEFLAPNFSTCDPRGSTAFNRIVPTVHE